MHNEPLTVFGDGQQLRGNTYVADCVEATTAALAATVGETFNIGGGETVSVWDVLQKLERLIGRKATVVRQAARPGDQRHTTADTTKLFRHLGWQPQVSLDEGLARQVEWQRSGEARVAA